MIIPPVKLMNEIWKHVVSRHGAIVQSCPARMNDEPGFLGVSKVVWYKVWFDTKDQSTPLFTSTSKSEALKRFQTLKEQYGT